MWNHFFINFPNIFFRITPCKYEPFILHVFFTKSYFPENYKSTNVPEASANDDVAYALLSSSARDFSQDASTELTDVNYETST